jgi:hypothetical protein
MMMVLLSIVFFLFRAVVTLRHRHYQLRGGPTHGTIIT